MKKKILILASHVPFSRGGAEVLVDSLRDAISALGHDVDIFSIPFSAEPKTELPQQMLNWRMLDLNYFAGNKIDLVIGTKFPTYYARHSNKVVWLIHQHRQAYELVETRFGDFSPQPEEEAVRQSIFEADTTALKEARAIYTISQNVSSRLNDFLSIDSTPLEPPCGFKVAKDVQIEKGSYLLSVGRLCSAKRVELMIRSMPEMPEPLTLKLVGKADEPGYEDFLRSEISKHNLEHKVELLGSVAQSDLEDLYRGCFAVLYVPFDEDFGFVTYEAAQYRKPLIVCADSGYVTQVVEAHGLGVIAEPDPDAICVRTNKLLSDSEMYQAIQEKCSNFPVDTNWSTVAETLISYA